MLKWVLKNTDTGDIFTLKRSPRGWDEVKLVHNRSDKYDGIFFDFSLELAFACKGGGKEFIDNAFNLKGSEANINLTLSYQCKPIGYKTLFEGKLNFASYKIEFRGKQLHTVVDIEKLGITQQIKNRENTDVDLLATESIGGVALTSYTYVPYDLTLHSRIIHLESEWEFANHGCCFHLPTPRTQGAYLFPPMEVILDEFEDTSLSIESCSRDITQEGFWLNARPIVNTENNKILVQDNIVTLTWNISGQLTITSREITLHPDPCLPDPCGTGPISLKSVSNIDFKLRFFFGNDTDTITEDSCATPTLGENIFYIDLITNPSFGLATSPEVIPFSNSGTRNMIIPPGYKMWCYWVIDYSFNSGSGDMSFDIEYTNKYLSIISDTVAPETVVDALPIHEAWSRVCEGITDQTLAFKSDFFGRTNSQGLSYATNGYGSFTAILDGLRIRGFTKVLTPPVLTNGETQKGIITKLKDIYDSCNAIWGIGLGVEKFGSGEVVRVEEKTYFYQDVSLLKLSNIPNIQMSFLSDNVYSEVEVGYKRWKAETKGGLEEPNSIARWLFPKIKSLNNSLRLVSEYVASMTAIEETRRFTFAKTEDSKYDDEIFVIALQRNVSNLNTAEKNENITISDALNSPSTAYNLRFNLFSNFDRVMNQFTTGLTKDTPHAINYSYLEGNGAMQFQFNDGHAGDLKGEAVRNVQNTAYPNTRHRRGDPILLPEQYTFTYPVPFDDYINILNNPYGYIEFSEGNNGHKKGYLKTLNYTLKTKMAEFTVIRKFK